MTQVTENPLYTFIRDGVPSDADLLHIVTFKFKADVTEEEQIAVMAECAALHKLCGGAKAGIKSFSVRPNIDQRKGYGWVEVGLFAGPEAFINFHAHPDHVAFGQKIAGLAEHWVVSDVAINPLGEGSYLEAYTRNTELSLEEGDKGVYSPSQSLRIKIR